MYMLARLVVEERRGIVADAGITFMMGNSGWLHFHLEQWPLNGRSTDSSCSGLFQIAQKDLQ